MRQLLVLSGKGGTGKTSIASALIHDSKAHFAADCDVEAPNLKWIMKEDEPRVSKRYMGMAKATIDQEKCKQCGKCMDLCHFGAIYKEESYHVDPWLCEGCGVCQRICPSYSIHMEKMMAGHLELYVDASSTHEETSIENLPQESVLSTASLKIGGGNSGKLVTAVKRELLEKARTQEWTIIDGPPGIGCPVIASMQDVDLILLVTEPSISAIHDMKRLIKNIDLFEIKFLVCINKYDIDSIKTKEIEDFCEAEGIDCIGKIPFDKEVLEKNNQGRTMDLAQGSLGQSIKNIIEKIKIYEQMIEKEEVR